MKFEKFDNAYQKQSNGEMYVPASDGSGQLIKTGFYFQVVTQELPVLGAGNKAVGSVVVSLSPWAFATTETASEIYWKLRPFVDKDVTLAIEESSFDNGPFPRSHVEYQIVARRGEKIARVNAGLVASNIARTTALLDGKVKQFPEPALQAAADELKRELEHQNED